MRGAFYEFVKVAIFGGASEKVGKGAGGEIYERGAKDVKKLYGKHKGDIAGLGLGALAGKALVGKGALGALLGLGVARRKELTDLTEKGIAAAHKAVKKGEKS